jgi:hypothetical protein
VAQRQADLLLGLLSGKNREARIISRFPKGRRLTAMPENTICQNYFIFSTPQ